MICKVLRGEKWVNDLVKLKEIRMSKNMNIKDVATQASISEAMYCLVENGKRRPSVDTAKRIANVLDFDWTKFFDDHAEEQKVV